MLETGTVLSGEGLIYGMNPRVSQNERPTTSQGQLSGPDAPRLGAAAGLRGFPQRVLATARGSSSSPGALCSHLQLSRKETENNGLVAFTEIDLATFLSFDTNQ